MIENEENNNINGYLENYSNDIKGSITLCSIGLIMLTIILIISYFLLKDIGYLIFAVFSFIVLIIYYRIYIYIRDKNEKIQFSLSKENFTIYKKDKTEVYKCEDIISFTIINHGNDVNLNYINENKEKKSKTIRIYEYSNTEFVNLANNILKNNQINYESDDNLAPPKDNTVEIINELIKNKQTLKFILLGKTKMFLLDGNSYTLQNIHSSLAFLNEKNEILELSISSISIEWNELSLKSLYEITYQKTSNKFIVKKIASMNSDYLKKIYSIENNIMFNSKYLFDKTKIINEVNLYYKLKKLSKITALSLLISLLLVFVHPWFFYIGITLLFILYPFLMLLYINRFKKDNGLKKS